MGVGLLQMLGKCSMQTILWAIGSGDPESLDRLDSLLVIAKNLYNGCEL